MSQKSNFSCWCLLSIKSTSRQGPKSQSRFFPYDYVNQLQKNVYCTLRPSDSLCNSWLKFTMSLRKRFIRIWKNIEVWSTKKVKEQMKYKTWLKVSPMKNILFLLPILSWWAHITCGPENYLLIKVNEGKEVSFLFP